MKTRKLFIGEVNRLYENEKMYPSHCTTIAHRQYNNLGCPEKERNPWSTNDGTLNKQELNSLTSPTTSWQNQKYSDHSITRCKSLTGNKNRKAILDIVNREMSHKRSETKSNFYLVYKKV